MDATTLTLPIALAVSALIAAATLAWTAAKAFYSFEAKLFSQLAEIKDEVHRTFVSREQFSELKSEVKQLSQSMQVELSAIRERLARLDG